MNSTIDQDTAATIAAVEEILIGGQPAAAPAVEDPSLCAATTVLPKADGGWNGYC
jgi:hypothetical protein